MTKEKRVLADVGMNNLPFPMYVISRDNEEGQPTVAEISIKARIMREYEAHWINKFIQIIHSHRGKIGTRTLKVNIYDYLRELKATSVNIDFAYPYFVTKTTPISKEECLVKYACTYSAKLTASSNIPTIRFRMKIPIITTDPASDPGLPGGLFGQLSTVTVEVQSKSNIYPEDIVDIVDRHALSPVFSFVTDADHVHIIEKIHQDKITSVVTTDSIKEELARNQDVEWYSVRCANFSMFHSYATVVGMEKNMYIPTSCYEFDEI